MKRILALAFLTLLLPGGARAQIMLRDAQGLPYFWITNDLPTRAEMTNAVIALALGGGGGAGMTTRVARATANIALTNTLFVNATNLAFSVAANTSYRFRFVVHYTTAATTTGIRFAVNGPASPTALRVGGNLPTGTAAMNSGSQSAYDTALFAATTGPGSTAVTGVIEGIFRNGANAGTLALRLASEVSASVVTVLADSHGELTSY